MHPRLIMASAVVAALATAAVVTALLAGGGGGRLDTAGGFAGSVRPRGIPPADFALRDQDGRTVSVAGLRGSVVVVTFMYSTCRDSCPITAQQIRGALDDLGHDVPVLAVSVDPRRDTPQRARTFVSRQHLLGRMSFLLGTAAQLAPVWRAFGINPQGPGRGPGFDHAAYTILLDRAGRQRVAFPTDKLTPEGLAHDISALAHAA